MSKIGYHMPWYLFGGAFSVAGGSLMCKPNAYHYRSLRYKISGLNILDTADPSTCNSQGHGYIVLIGIGAGIFIQSSFSVAPAKVPQKHASDAGSFIAFAQKRGSVMALAISRARYLSKYCRQESAASFT